MVRFREYLFTCYVLLTTMVGKGHSQVKDEEVPLQERNVKELIIDDILRKIIELTYQLN